MRRGDIGRKVICQRTVASGRYSDFFIRDRGKDIAQVVGQLVGLLATAEGIEITGLG